ncbi:MAG: glutamine-hydrolyzing carbamoyl-phosphate synthase small subunit [Bacillota bacterium]|nr:glutamine-hydrolyzing carbamoyl-phosphate synthase small subunit [Bacillota bacterium]
MQGMIVLEDGMVFKGEALGAHGTVSGEVVFTTSMTGYQEVLTDPSYCGQIVTMTYPLIGNYGSNLSCSQSVSPWVKGFIVHEACDFPSHGRSLSTISDYLAENNVVGLTGVSTRALTRHLRDRGTMRGAITTDLATDHELLTAALGVNMDGLVRQVTTPRPYRIFGNGPKVAVLDFGVKTGILKELAALDMDIAVLPATCPADVVLDMEPDGVLLSNGPGDPTDATYAIETVRRLLGQMPIFGICLGHQVLALALGAKTYKLKYGHRGGNHPVKDLQTGRTYITSQNHGYAIDWDSLGGTGLTVTHTNQNDGTIEGVRNDSLRVFSVQYHPEGCPGPEDSRGLFQRFAQTMGFQHAKTA